MTEQGAYETIAIERGDGIAWLIFNRPAKRNAINPTMCYEFIRALDELEADEATRLVIVTGAGDSWSAGMDLKEFFRDLDDKPIERDRAHRASVDGGWSRLNVFPKPTIAMVNGYCFGGAFMRLIACDLAIAADEATFGLSEVNWGIFPGGTVGRVLADALTERDALYYIMTGDTFDGKQAAALRLVNFSVPRSRLRDETLALARKLLSKSPHALRACKESYKYVRRMDYWQAAEYLDAKIFALRATDPEHGRDEGIRRFIDDKAYRPGLASYRDARTRET